MITEIEEIPHAAMRCYEATRGERLPLNVPYLGMGSSYFAALALKYQGMAIEAEPASEYYSYINTKNKLPLGVLISQSGRSSETLWCRERFERIIAVVNDENSPLAEARNVEKNIFIKAGEERFTSSKTYVNTLIALYNGLGVDAKPAIDLLLQSMDQYKAWARVTAESIFERVRENRLNGVTIIGSGPNIATAYMGALGLQESAKLAAAGMPAAQYDHGPKEAAGNSVVIAVGASGPTDERMANLLDVIAKAGATTFQIKESNISEKLTPIVNIVPLFYLMHFLMIKLGVNKVFAIGDKVTQVQQ